MSIQRVAEKYWNCCHKQFISTLNYKLHGFPFKVIPIESLSCLYALLKGFFWDAPQLHCYGSLDGLHTFKTDPLDDPLKCWIKKKKLNKIRWIGRFFQGSIVPLGLELPDTQGVLSIYIIIVKQPWFVLPRLSSLLAQKLLVDLLIDHLDQWQELAADDACHRRMGSTWLSCFLRPRWRHRLLLIAPTLCFVLKDPCLISSNEFLKQVWFS